VALQHLLPALPIHIADMAVLGMAAVVGSSTGAVLTAIVIIFEMTRDYHVIIQVIIVVSIAYGVRQFFMEDSIYSFKLTRRGHFVPSSLQTNLFMLRRAVDVYDSRVVRVGHTRDLAEVRRRFRHFGSQAPNVLVLDDGNVKAIFSSRRHFRLTRRARIRSWMDEHMATEFIVVGAQDMIFDIVGRLRAADCEVALVTAKGKMEHPREVVGVLTLSDIVRSSRLARQISRES
jgi:CIC family chloride channel protein